MRICFVQQHPVDEQKIPAAILRWVTLLDKFRDAGHTVFAIAPNTRLRFEERDFRGIRQLQIPTPGSGLKSLDMFFFAIFLIPGMFIARRRFGVRRWFMDELFVCFALLCYRIIHPRDIVCYDVMGIHYYQVKKNNRKISRHVFLSSLYGIMEHITLWGSTFVTTINIAHAQILRRWSRRPCHVIRDAVEFNEQGKLLETPDGLTCKNPGEVFLTFVGKISNNRLDELFEVLPSLMERLPSLKFIIVGDGPFLEKYQQLTLQLGLGGRVEFCGFVPHEHLPAFLSQADITYSDDWSDIGFPMKVFEYMAMGSAILVEGTPAVHELMQNDYNCVTYSGLRELYDSVVRLAEDPALRQRIGEKAQEEAASFHNWNDRLGRFEKLYDHYSSNGSEKLVEEEDYGLKT
jgi:glycosyltransferase involved in cell wall biosynthesis